MPVSTLASIADVGLARASGIIGELSDLGIVGRRAIGRTVLVFGSFARGETDAHSDLDVLAVRSSAADPTNGPLHSLSSPSRHANSLAARCRCTATTSMTCAATPATRSCPGSDRTSKTVMLT